MNYRLALSLLILPIPVLAETPQQIRAAYASEAAATQPGFSPAAQRGERLFRQQFTVTAKMPSCTNCHTANPLQVGEPRAQIFPDPSQGNVDDRTVQHRRLRTCL